MDALLDLVERKDGVPFLRSKRIPLAEVEGRLQAGETVEALLAAFAMSAADLLAALAYLALGPTDALGPTLEQVRPARPILASALSESSLAKLLPGSARPARLALAAGLLQAHDFWDASHTAAQQADDLGETRSSAYWHGIAHRREPDSGNAGYWFRRVGRHPLFEPLGTEAQALIAAQPSVPGADRTVRSGLWDPFAFVEFCRSSRPGTASEHLARRLQRLEMALLLDSTAAPLL